MLEDCIKKLTAEIQRLNTNLENPRMLVTAASVPGAEAEAEVVAAEASTEVGAEPPSKDDVRRALKDLGREKAVNVLGQLGVIRLSELDESKFPKLLQLAREAA